MFHANGIFSRLGVFSTRAAREKNRWQLTEKKAVFETGDPFPERTPLVDEVVASTHRGYAMINKYYNVSPDSKFSPYTQLQLPSSVWSFFWNYDFWAFSKSTMAEEQKWISSNFHLPLKLSESSELPSTMSAVIGTPGLVDCSIVSICTSTCPKKQTNKAKRRSLSASKHSQISKHSSNLLAIKQIYDCTTANCSTTQNAPALGRLNRLDDPSNLLSLFRHRRPAWQFLHWIPDCSQQLGEFFQSDVLWH